MAGFTMTANLKANIQDFSKKLQQASSQMSDFAKDANKKYGDATASLKSHNLGLKDTARIVQGILVSQAFYRIANAISEATSSLFEFNEQLDYAQVTYSALFGSSTVAEQFLGYLKELSVSSIFDYDTLTQASKKLLAYGMDYQSLGYVMEGLTNLGAMSGDTAALDRISYALGQIYAKGKLSAEEMRQLANAYVPIQQILKDKLGLSDEDLGRVGDLNIPAEDAINAIVDYANEQFGSVGDAAMMTITGLKNKIVDSMKVLGNEMTRPLTIAWKSFLAFAADGIANIRDLYSSGGMGNVFEHFVPDPEKQTIIRAFLANLHNMFLAIVSVLKVISNVAGNFITVFVNAFNVVAPVITTVVNSLAYLLNAMLNTRAGTIALRTAILAAAAAFIVLKVHAMGALVVTTLTKAIKGLSSALLLLASIIVKHPIIALMVGLAVALIGVSGASDKASAALSKLFGTISGPVDSSDIFKKTEGAIDGASNSADAFNNKLGAGSEAAKDLADNINKAGKEAKRGLLSFDEVFKLNEPSTSSADAGETSGIGDLLGDLGDLGSGLGDFLMPEIPDFSDYIDGFTGNLFGGLKDGLLDKFKSIGLGALLGGLLGGIFGKSLLGVKIGAAIGAFAGWLWDMIAEKLELTDLGKVAIPIATGLGAAIGFVIGGPAGAVLGGGIGALVGWITETISKGIETGNWDPLKNTLRTVLGAALGAAIAFAVGGPIGLAIGGAVALIIGNFDTLWTIIKDWTSNTNARFVEWKTKALEEFKQFTSGLKEEFTTWITDTITGFASWYAETMNGFADWCAGSILGFRTWAADVKQGFVDWITESAKGFFDWFANTKKGFEDWLSGTNGNIASWVITTSLSFLKWWGDTKNGFLEWASGIKSSIAAWAIESLGSFIAWYADTKSRFAEWKLTTLKTVAGWAIAIANAWNKLWDPRTWISGWSLVASWFSDLFKGIQSWFSGLGTQISKWWKGLWNDKEVSINTSTHGGSGGNFKTSLSGHASGGVFNREHIARFAEGNKAEAIIPLEERTAMQPFVDAVANGITQTLAPILANVNVSAQPAMQPLYVGTLIADERGLKELERRMQVIRVQENKR